MQWNMHHRRLQQRDGQVLSGINGQGNGIRVEALKESTRQRHGRS
jgi:hypothetical protein